MAKKVIVNTPVKVKNSILINSTSKFVFEMEYKYNQIHLSIYRKDTSNFHVGKLKFNNIYELKNNIEVQSLLKLEDIDEFFKSFKYK